MRCGQPHPDYYEDVVCHEPTKSTVRMINMMLIYDDEDDSFDSESDKEDLVSENRGQELNGKFIKKVAALHGDGSRMFDDYPGEIKDDE